MAWLSGYLKRRKLTINNTNVDAPLSDFPVLIKISDSSGISSTDVTSIFTELGSDANRKKIAVTTSNGTTQCYVEIERFDYVNSGAWLWVKVPSVASGDTTILYLYYDANQADNISYVGDTTDTITNNVWDSNFVVVYHMAQDPNGDTIDAIKESTSNQYDGTPAGSMTSVDLVDGKVGKGIDFDGSNDNLDSNEDGPFRFGSTNFTYEACAKLASKITDRAIVAKGYNYELRYDVGEDYWMFNVNDGTYKYAKFSQTNASLDTWHYIVGTSEGTVLKIYVDIVEGATVGSIGTIQETASTLTIGTGSGGRFFSGIIDEVRISNIARSVAWLKATYYSNWDELISFGVEEAEIICYISGYVKEGVAPVNRQIYLHNRNTGKLVGSTTSSGIGGYFYVETTYSGAHYVVCLDDAEGLDYNDLIYGRIYPVTISG